MSLYASEFVPDTQSLNYFVCRLKQLKNICIGGFKTLRKGTVFTGTCIFGDGDTTTRLSITPDADDHYCIYLLDPKYFLKNGIYNVSILISDGGNSNFQVNNCTFNVVDNKYVAPITTRTISAGTVLAAFQNLVSQISNYVCTIRINDTNVEGTVKDGTLLYASAPLTDGSVPLMASRFKSGSVDTPCSTYTCCPSKDICLTDEYEIHTCLIDQSGCQCVWICEVQVAAPAPAPAQDTQYWILDARPRAVCRNDTFCYEAVATTIPIGGRDQAVTCFATINWGDGHVCQVGISPIIGTTSYLIKDSHKYKHCGFYNLTVTYNGIPSTAVISVYDCETKCKHKKRCDKEKDCDDEKCHSKKCHDKK